MPGACQIEWKNAGQVDSEEALRTMLDSGFRHLPVVEGGEVIGMVSMRDLAAETR